MATLTASAFLVIGLGLGGLLAIWPRLLSIALVSIYWLIGLLWSLDVITFSQAPSIAWASLLNINLAYHIDGLTKLFALLISGIGIFVFGYAYIYTQYDMHNRAKLFSILQCFAVAMFGIVLADDLIFLFLCWEATTLTSYLLIQFDVKDKLANQAAFNSIFITVLGSLGMLIGFILLAGISGSWSIQDNIHYFSSHTKDSAGFNASCILILLGALTKSAQFPVYFWLTDAMKAPTPVSAYLHSATMVNAGIYLLARLHLLYGEVSFWYPVLSFFGLSTMVVSSILSVLAKDFKVLLAYTTLFALGSMVYLLGSDHPLGIEAFGLFFIFHGIYKAAAFMLVGTLDKEYHTRELSKLSGVARYRPGLAIIMIIILGAMAGLPPFFGFTVKQMIFEAKLAGEVIAYFLIGISLVSSMLIAATSFRCLWYFFKPSVSARTSFTPLKFGLICPAVLALLILVLSNTSQGIQGLLLAMIESVVSQTETEYANPNVGLSYSLSILTVLGGLGLCFLYTKIHTFHVLWPSYLNPKLLFEKGLEYFLLAGKKITSLTQGQPFHIQLSIMLLMMLGILGVSAGIGVGELNFHFQFNDPLLACFLILSAVSLIVSNNIVYNLISLSLIGIAISFFFMLHGGVDLAMAQLLIEVLTIIVVLISLHGKNIAMSENRQPIHFLNAVIATGFGVYTSFMLLALHDLPLNTQLQNFYLQNSLSLAHGRNVVNVILVDFRAFDTLGEVLVIVASAIGVIMVTKKMARVKGK